MNEPAGPDRMREEEEFFEYAEFLAGGDAPLPRTELEETMIRVHRALQSDVAPFVATQRMKETIWDQVLERVTPVAAMPGSAGSVNVPTPGTGSARANRSLANQYHGWSLSRFAANATLALLIVIVGVGAWKGLGGINSNGPGNQPTIIPGIAIQEATPESSVEPASAPVDASAITNCDLSGDIPIVTNLSEGDSPLAQTSLYLVQTDQSGADPRGTLTIGCEDEERVVLAENVVSVWQGPWSGIAAYAVLVPGVDDPTLQQQGYVDIASGRTLLFGPSTSETPYDRFHADGSPWVAGPSLEDPATVLVADLRTFESRPFADVAGMPLPGTPVIVSTPSDDGSIGVGFAHPGSIDATGGVYLDDTLSGSPDGVLLLGASFDDAHWISAPDALPLSSPLALSPDGSVLAVVSSGEGGGFPESYTYGLIDLASGELIASSTELPNSGTPEIRWARNGEAVVYLAGSTVQMLEVGGTGDPVTVFDAGELLGQLKTTWNPDVVVVSERRDHGSDADPGQTAEDIVYSINLVNGETQEFAGMDASGMVSWITTAGALVMFEWLDIPAELANYSVFDPVSGELIGEITDAPSAQSSGPSIMVIGPDSVSVSADGRREVVAFSTQHIYAFTVGPDGSSMEQASSPDGLLSEVALTANVYLSQDGSQLSLTGEGDEGRTRYLTSLNDSFGNWTAIPNTVVGGPGPVVFVPASGD